MNVQSSKAITKSSPAGRKKPLSSKKSAPLVSMCGNNIIVIAYHCLSLILILVLNLTLQLIIAIIPYHWYVHNQTLQFSSNIC